MKYIILLISATISLIYARPQNVPYQKNTEYYKQSVEDLPKTYPLSTFSNDGIIKQRQIEESTREILEKIDELNKKQGLLPKKPKPSYFHFPFSYSRASSEESERINSTNNSTNNNLPLAINSNADLSNVKTREGNGFKFPNNPFVNPVFEYLESKSKENNDKILQNEANKLYNPITGFRVSVIDTNPEITKEDIIPGQYIKRKITHHQTFYLPNINTPSNTMGGYYQTPHYSPQAVPAVPPYSYNYPNPYTQMYRNEVDNRTQHLQFQNIEKQTIDAVKNIVTTSQAYNPIAQFVPIQQYQGYYPQPFHQVLPQQIQPTGNYGPFQVYGPIIMPNHATPTVDSVVEDNYKARQWDGSWPGAQYFPIVIKDPLMQMYNAITSMVEYGMAGGGGSGGCKKPNKPPKKMEKDNNNRNFTSSLTNEKNSTKDRNPKIIEEAGSENQVEYESTNNLMNNFTMSDLNKTVELNLMHNNSSSSQPSNPLNSTTMEIKKFKSHWVLNNGSAIKNLTAHRQIIGTKLPNLANLSSANKNHHKVEVRQSPPIRDQTPYEDEIDEDKAEDISIENDHNKKVFTRENTGSGIFIHKLKVRKGGVAIAGPGGIATAGSGGTAIVGPNGVAYTHPDGLAIAGSGTRVVAVDPNISLSDIVNNSTVGGGRNRTKLHHARVGKVVAVGPVVYYNKG